MDNRREDCARAVDQPVDLTNHSTSSTVSNTRPHIKNFAQTWDKLQEILVGTPTPEKREVDQLPSEFQHMLVVKEGQLKEKEKEIYELNQKLENNVKEARIWRDRIGENEFRIGKLRKDLKENELENKHYRDQIRSDYDRICDLMNKLEEKEHENKRNCELLKNEYLSKLVELKEELKMIESEKKYFDKIQEETDIQIGELKKSLEEQKSRFEEDSGKLKTDYDVRIFELTKQVEEREREIAIRDQLNRENESRIQQFIKNMEEEDCKNRHRLEETRKVHEHQLLEMKTELGEKERENESLRCQLIVKNDIPVCKSTEKLEEREHENDYGHSQSSKIEIKSLRERIQHKEEAMKYLEKLSAEVKNLEVENNVLKGRLLEWNNCAVEPDPKTKLRTETLESENKRLKNKLVCKEKQFDADMSDRDGKIKALQSEIADMKKKKSFLKNQNVSLRTDLEEAREKLLNMRSAAKKSISALENISESDFTDVLKTGNSLNEENVRLRQEVTDLKEKLSAITDRYELPFLSNNEEYAVKASKLESQVNELKTKLAQLQTGKIVSLENKIKERDCRIVRLESDLATAEQIYRTKTVEFDQDYKSLKDQVDVLKMQMVNATDEEEIRIKHELNEEKARADQMEKSFKEAEESINLWRNQVSSLECRLFEIEKENAQLRQLRNKIIEQSKRVDELEMYPDPKHFKPLEERIPSLEGDKKRLGDQIKSHEDGIHCLTKETNDIGREYRDVKRQLAELNKNYKSLLKDHTDLLETQNVHLQEIGCLREAASKTNNETKRLQSENCQLVTEERNMAARKDELEKVIFEMDEKTKLIITEKEDLTGRLKVVNEINKAMVEQHVEDTKTLEKLNEEVQSMTKEFRYLKNNVSVVEEEKNYLTGQHTEDVKNLKQVIEQVEEAAKERDKWKNLSDVLMFEKQEMQKRHQELSRKFKTTAKELNEVVDQRNKFRKRLDFLENQKESDGECSRIKAEGGPNRAGCRSCSEYEEIVDGLSRKVSNLMNERRTLVDTRAKTFEIIDERDRAEKELAHKNGMIDSLTREVRKLERDLIESRVHGRDSVNMPIESNQLRNEWELKQCIRMNSIMEHHGVLAMGEARSSGRYSPISNENNRFDGSDERSNHHLEGLCEWRDEPPFGYYPSDNGPDEPHDLTPWDGGHDEHESERRPWAREPNTNNVWPRTRGGWARGRQSGARGGNRGRKLISSVSFSGRGERRYRPWNNP